MKGVRSQRVSVGEKREWVKDEWVWMRSRSVMRGEGSKAPLEPRVIELFGGSHNHFSPILSLFSHSLSLFS